MNRVYIDEFSFVEKKFISNIDKKIILNHESTKKLIDLIIKNDNEFFNIRDYTLLDFSNFYLFNKLICNNVESIDSETIINNLIFPNLYMYNLFKIGIKTNKILKIITSHNTGECNYIEAYDKIKKINPHIDYKNYKNFIISYIYDLKLKKKKNYILLLCNDISAFKIYDFIKNNR